MYRYPWNCHSSKFQQIDLAHAHELSSSVFRFTFIMVVGSYVMQGWLEGGGDVTSGAVGVHRVDVVLHVAA
jgi:hypothetical protein